MNKEDDLINVPRYVAVLVSSDGLYKLMAPSRYILTRDYKTVKLPSPADECYGIRSAIEHPGIQLSARSSTVDWHLERQFVNRVGEILYMPFVKRDEVGKVNHRVFDYIRREIEMDRHASIVAQVDAHKAIERESMAALELEKRRVEKL